jgi:hypothetical protein
VFINVCFAAGMTVFLLSWKWHAGGLLSGAECSIPGQANYGFARRGLLSASGKVTVCPLEKLKCRWL